MLPKGTRLPRELFTELLEKSRYANSLHFTLRYRLSDHCAHKIGVSASKKVSKSAVTRNTIRRRVYSSIQEYIPIMPPGLYLFVAKPKSDVLKGEKLISEIKALLKSVV